MKSGINDTNTMAKAFGKRLQNARLEMNLSRQSFCDRINAREDVPIRKGDQDSLNPDRLKKWEYGDNPIEIEWIPAICAELHVGAGLLFGEYKERTRSISDIVEKTNLSERTVLSIIEERDIADALNCLDRAELLTFSRALNNAILQITESVALLEENNPNDSWMIGLQQQKMELAAFQFREVCGKLISEWCGLETVISAMKKKDEEYHKELIERQMESERARKESARRPRLSQEETEKLFQLYRQAIERMEADNG